MKISRFCFLGMLGATLLNSCSKDDDHVEPPVAEETYESGFFVLNEGSQGAGTVTYISDDFQRKEQGIYAAANPGDDIGKFGQSIFFQDDLAFIISNGSNLITVANRYTFELIGKVDSGLSAPRYGVALNGKAYVTNQAGWETTTDDYLAVLDLETMEVEETIPLNASVEEIVEENGLLYIQNAAFGIGNKITVFDPSSNSITRTIEVAEGLNSIEVENNTLYALSSGSLEAIDLNSFETISEFTFPEELEGAQNLEIEDGNSYYTIGNSVYTISINAGEPAQSSLLDYTSDSDFGVMYGFEVEGDRIYIADGGDFASNSFVEVYNLKGELLERITVGVGPNGFYFND